MKKQNKVDWSSFFWDCQSSLLVADERFKPENIGNTKFADIKQRIIYIKQEHNKRSLTSARQLMTTYNINRNTKETNPFDDISQFLPYPSVWVLFSRKINVSRRAAQEFLYHYPHLPTLIQLTFKDDIEILRLIANK